MHLLKVRVRAPNIEAPPRGVNFARGLGSARSATLALACATLAACGKPGNPAPVDLGANWPTYLGNFSRTPFLDERVSTEPPEIVWSADIGSPNAQPVATDRVIMTAGRDRYIYTLSREDGSQFWRKRLAGPAKPILAGGTIYALVEGEGELRVISLHTSEDAWKTEFPSVRHPPALAGDTLLVAAENGMLFALDLAKRVRIWRTQFPRPPIAGPVVAGDFVLYASIDSVYSVTRRLGLRRAAMDSDEILTGELAIGDSMAYAATENGSIRAWTLPDLEPAWTASGFASFIAGPVIADDVGYALSSSGQLIHFNARDGSARVIAVLEGAFQAAPVVVRNGLLAGNLDGRLFFRTRNGEPIWDVELEGTIEWPVAVYDGRILVALYGADSGVFGGLRGILLELR